MGCAIQPCTTHINRCSSVWPLLFSRPCKPFQCHSLLRATAFINNPAEHMLGNHWWLWVLVALRSAWLPMLECRKCGAVAGSGMTRIKDNFKNAVNEGDREFQDRVKERTSEGQSRCQLSVQTHCDKAVNGVILVFGTFSLLWRRQKRLCWNYEYVWFIM